MTKIERVYRALLKSGRPATFAVQAIGAAIATKYMMLPEQPGGNPDDDAMELERCYREIRESDV